eukprot:767263-Hanusia_phi.AAC.9
MKVKCVNCEAWFSVCDNAVEAKAADQGVQVASLIEDYHTNQTYLPSLQAAPLLLNLGIISKTVCCQFHPGVYRRSGVTVATGVRTGWSCCRQIAEVLPVSAASDLPPALVCSRMQKTPIPLRRSCHNCLAASILQGVKSVWLLQVSLLACSCHCPTCCPSP